MSAKYVVHVMYVCIHIYIYGPYHCCSMLSVYVYLMMSVVMPSVGNGVSVFAGSQKHTAWLVRRFHAVGAP